MIYKSASKTDFRYPGAFAALISVGLTTGGLLLGGCAASSISDTAGVPDVATLPLTNSELSALDAARQLTVKGRAPKTGYTRSQFGQAWADVDRNGCDTRNDILRRDLTDIEYKPATRNCKIISGLLIDPYSGNSIQFTQGANTSSAIQIDHVVALSDAWQKGAQSWSEATRIIFANDPLNLLAVDGPLNQQKGDGDTATWLPPNKAYRCAYAARQVAVKRLYGLWVTAAEQAAMVRVLTSCPTQPLPDGGYVTTGTMEPIPGVAAPSNANTDPGFSLPSSPSSPGPSAATPTPSSPAPPTSQPPMAPSSSLPNESPGNPNVYYKNCTEAWAAGAAPIKVGEPGYGKHLDRDGDGIGCETKPRATAR